MPDITSEQETIDQFTQELLDTLFAPSSGMPDGFLSDEIALLARDAGKSDLTAPIIKLFSRLKAVKIQMDISPDLFDLSKQMLLSLARKHQKLDEHGVSVGGRVNRALPIVNQAIGRVDEYLLEKDEKAPSGIELWERIQENKARIMTGLNIGEADWNTYSGQISNCIDSVDVLSRILDLPSSVIEEVTRVTDTYRMRLTPYYASLIQPGAANDPVLLQSA